MRHWRRAPPISRLISSASPAMCRASSMPSAAVEVRGAHLQRLRHRAHTVVEFDVGVPQRVPELVGDLRTPRRGPCRREGGSGPDPSTAATRAAQTAHRDDRESTVVLDAELGTLRGQPEFVQVDQCVPQCGRIEAPPFRQVPARRASLADGEVGRSGACRRVAPATGPVWAPVPPPRAAGARASSSRTRGGQSASVPRSPVRTRTTDSTGVIHTLPSPILPVRAASTMVSTTFSTAESSTTTSTRTFGHEIDGVLGAAVHLGVALLAPVALHLTDGHAEHARLFETRFDILERERLDDCRDQLHILILPSAHWLLRSLPAVLVFLSLRCVGEVVHFKRWRSRMRIPHARLRRFRGLLPRPSHASRAA